MDKILGTPTTPTSCKVSGFWLWISLFYWLVANAVTEKTREVTKQL